MVTREGRVEGRDNQGIWDRHIHTAVFKMDNQQGLTVQHRKLLNIMWQAGWEGKGVWGKIDTCMAESHCCPPETITPLLISYTLIQNKVFCFFFFKGQAGVMGNELFFRVAIIKPMNYEEVVKFWLPKYQMTMRVIWQWRTEKKFIDPYTIPSTLCTLSYSIIQ